MNTRTKQPKKHRLHFQHFDQDGKPDHAPLVLCTDAEVEGVVARMTAEGNIWTADGGTRSWNMDR